MLNINNLIQLHTLKLKLESIFKIKINIDSLGYDVSIPYAETYMKGYNPNNIFTNEFNLIDALIFTINDLDYPVSSNDIILLCDFLNYPENIKNELLTKCYNSLIKGML